jgi:hypothetical protein
MSKVVGDKPLHSRNSRGLKSETGRLGLLLPVPLTRHSFKNARLHSISAQLGKSLRLARSIAAPTTTIALVNREHGLGKTTLF